MTESAQAMLVLFQQGTDGTYQSTGQHWLLQSPNTTIGRWEDNDVVIPDRWISRHHAQVRSWTPLPPLATDFDYDTVVTLHRDEFYPVGSDFGFNTGEAHLVFARLIARHQ